ncbi:hypothetical protein AMS68_005475 [Peltaster fructicola]|uniref:Uncharacterized protein n=1 Tax=Peltaster fructicola TaxID=286661 RepID=A0A6H0XZD9_9PEZI|nr:hypothetical protein AMS68_005475 [Peltaster fructicola]
MEHRIDPDSLDPPAEVGPLTGNVDPYNHVIVIDTGAPKLPARVFSSTVPGDRVRPASNPRSDEQPCSAMCKYRLGIRQLPAVDLIKMYERKLVELCWMPDFRSNDIKVAGDPDYPQIELEGYLLRMNEAYRDCGWPGPQFDGARLQVIVDVDDFADDCEPSSSDDEDDEQRDRSDRDEL